ncbi:cellulase/cellobiase CelA1 [Catenulispora sp. GAS73]
MAPGALSTTGRAYAAPTASCLATGLHVTADVYEDYSPNKVAGADADLVITPPAPSVCHITFTTTYWSGGFTANVTITNNSASVINSWSLAFSFPGDQKITNAWNASVAQNGTSVTAASLGYNASIAPGGSQSFGFQGTWALGGASPTAFSVNGAMCS